MKQRSQSNISQTLVQALRYQRLLRLLKNAFWAKAYVQHNLWPEQVSVEAASGYLTLENSGLQLKQSEASFLPLLQYVQPLLTVGGRFSRDQAHSLFFEVDDLQFAVQAPADIAILYEIFACGCYSLKLPPDEKNLVLWDVGMNIGIASLYFARNEAFDAVIGYEPFAPTFRQAEEQFKLNPAVNNKITAINKGIGDKNETLTLAYDERRRESLSVFSPNQSFKGLPDAQQEMVQIEDAAQALQHILKQYPGRSIVVKMDCEGGEHRILPALSRAKLLHHIKALLLEWHGPNVHHLEQLLLESGFSVISVTAAVDHQGYIYAVRMSNG